MDISFYLRCFGVGLTGAASCGPLFFLTFNRSSWYGFSRGFFTALGAALGDGFLFFLGLFGVLKFLSETHWIMLSMNLIGGIFLLVVGFCSFKKKQKHAIESQPKSLPPLATAIKSFFLAVANPLSVLFFMIMVVKVLSISKDSHLPLEKIITGSALVFCGSLTVLSTVAYTASHLRRAINENYLRKISIATGIIFISIGIYLFYDFVLRITQIPLNLNSCTQFCGPR